MLTKKRMLEIIAYVDSDISATEIKEIINKLSTEEKIFFLSLERIITEKMIYLIILN